MSNITMSKAGAKIAMTLVMFAIFAVMVGVASTYPPGARFMPYVVGIPGLVMCAIQLFLDIRDLRANARDDDDDGKSEMERAAEEVARVTGRKMDFSEAEGATAVVVEESKEGRGRREAIVWASFLGLIGGILLFGFWIAVPLFIGGFLRFYAGRTWRFSLLLTAAATAVYYGAFVLGLKVVLHEGFVIEAIKDHFGWY
ncbi:MAG TPA: tripartite tricarboxylate transporter TctB family protein [Alphaproteobacteria bacterium]|nr:tripartite tricarboxylate transporter TctB family protein [Alphaproteobacteria bacterium]